MKTVAALLGCLLALLAVRSFLNDWFRNRFVPSVTGSGAQCLELTGSTTRDQDSGTYIVGSFRNNCDRPYPQVTVSFKLERPSGPTRDLPEAVVSAYERDVKPGETRNFKTAMPVPRNTIFRLDSISGF